MSILKTLLKIILDRGVNRSYSQFGEDLIIRPYVPKTGGVYVDVGCYHPILYSNTYRLYRRGWSGIVIDPNPKLKPLFAFFRPRDRFVHAAIGKKGETHEYVMFADGAYNTLDPASAKEYEARSAIRKRVAITTTSLSDVTAGMKHVDLLNIDTEGFDLEVLKTYDWRIPPRLIIVEALPDSETGAFLRQKGYVLVGLTKLNSIFLYER